MVKDISIFVAGCDSPEELYGTGGCIETKQTGRFCSNFWVLHVIVVIGIFSRIEKLDKKFGFALLQNFDAKANVNNPSYLIDFCRRVLISGQERAPTNNVVNNESPSKSNGDISGRIVPVGS